MSGFKNEQPENENEPIEITPELEALLNIRNHLEMQINVLNEQMAFGESLDGSLSPFIEAFSNEFKGHFSRTSVEQDLQVLEKMMGEVVQQIKGVCKHQYEEDNIDEVERCVKSYAKQYQYRKYKEVYKADINMLKDLINDCGEFNEKTNLKIKWKSNKQSGGNHYIAIFRD
jgi:uncharacterized protein YjaG (DUF416 family)